MVRRFWLCTALVVLVLPCCGGKQQAGEITPDDVAGETLPGDGSGQPPDAEEFELSGGCEPGSQVCTGNRFATCAEDGSGYLLFVDCPGDQFCFDNECCAPDCESAQCGPDGCGGVCGDCPPEEECEEGQCVAVACMPDCTNRVCSEDGCGGWCGECPEGEECLLVPTPSEWGQLDLCHPTCESWCAQNSLACGEFFLPGPREEEGCFCGECPEGEVCIFEDGLPVEGNGESEPFLPAACACLPDCAGKECGGDGCGGSCGQCVEPAMCGGGGQEGICVKPEPAAAVVPAGPFWMGCNEAVDAQCTDHEYPYHLVEVPQFEMDLTEVTVQQYAECVGAAACSPSTEGSSYWSLCTWELEEVGNHPINCVDWYQASAYCQWGGRRLCTAAEWEKAARGGCELYGDCAAESPRYPWGNDDASCLLAVMDDGGAGCGVWGTSPVGIKPAGASPYGILDMAGGVTEWVQDCWHIDYNESDEELYGPPPTDGSAWEDDGCSDAYKSVRGGSWYYFAKHLRVSFREGRSPEERTAMQGIRCCK